MANAKEEGGTDDRTSCGIKNDTPNPIKFLFVKIWQGEDIPPTSFPPEIQVHQRISFSAVKASFGSKGAVVYRSYEGNGGKGCDHLMAWSNPRLTNGPNSVWTETRDLDQFYKHGVLHNIQEQLDKPCNSFTDVPWNGYVSNITITHATSAEVEASFTKNAADNA